MEPTCRVDGCSNRPVARGLCNNDYQRAKSQGTLDEIAPKVHPPCARCGGVIPQVRRFGAAFCSTSCKDAEMDARKHEAVAQRRGTRRVECAWCAVAIEQTRSDQRFCSRQCADSWRNDQTRLQTIRAKRALARKCELCGESIPAARPTQAIYCSPECKTLAGRAGTPRRRQNMVASNRMRLYGITPEQYAARLVEQDNACAVCRRSEAGGKGAWHVDHDHATGEVRGLLCHNCNLGLGNFMDNPDLLNAAAIYLKR